MNCDNCGGSLTGGNDTRQTLKDNVEGDEHCEASDCIRELRSWIRDLHSQYNREMKGLREEMRGVVASLRFCTCTNPGGVRVLAGRLNECTRCDCVIEGKDVPSHESIVDCIQALGEKGSGLELLVGNLSNSKQDKEFVDRAFGGSLLNRRNSERRKGGQ